MDASMSRLSRNSIVALIILALHGCITIEKTSTGDFDAKKRLENAIEEILQNSKKAETEMFAGNRGGVAPELVAFVQRHFSRANEIVLQHTIAANNSIPFISHNDYLDKRKLLFEFTLALDPTLEIVAADSAFAIAFPSGTIVLSQPLAEAFYVTDEGYDSALMGILIHELLHVRDGHAIEQWVTADGRNSWVTDKVLGSAADMTILIPFLSINYDIDYEVAFKSAKQLPELSEYAADLGAVSLLEKNGFDRESYTVFLNDIYARSRTSRADLGEPFSWMKGRIECLDIFSTTEFNEDLSGIVIGSEEDGDNMVLTLDFGRVYKFSRQLDNPSELRELVGVPMYEEYSDAELREIVLSSGQKSMFTACSIQNTFSDIEPVGGVLTTPGFDLSMFTMHY